MSRRPRGKKNSSYKKDASSRVALPENLRLVPGFHAVNEAVKVRPQAIHSLWMRKDWEGVDELIDLKKWAEKLKITIHFKSMQELNRFTSGHQGVVALLSEAPELDWEDLKAEHQSMVVALDGLEDPHNLGAILRTAWLMNAKALFVPGARSVHLTPAAIKVASGGAEHVPVQIEANLPSLLKSLKDVGFWIFGLSHKGNNELWNMDLPEKVVWVIGSEGKGLRVPVERVCDELVRIPQSAASASYNASVAAAIVMAETQRQMRS